MLTPAEAFHILEVWVAIGIIGIPAAVLGGVLTGMRVDPRWPAALAAIVVLAWWVVR